MIAAGTGTVAPIATARGQRRQRQLEEEAASVSKDHEKSQSRTPAQQRRTVARLHAAEAERQDVLASERKLRAKRERKAEERLLELADVGKVRPCFVFT